MTKIQAQYDLVHPLDPEDLDEVAGVHGIYGILHVLLAPTLDSVSVEYDASRLTALQVQAALQRSGIPVRQNPGM